MPSPDARRSLALNTVVRNLGLALLIASSQVPGPGAELVVIAFTLVMVAVAAVATYCRHKELLIPI